MNGRSKTYKLFTIAGIRVGVDFSWFVVLFLAIFWLSNAFKIMLGGSDTVAYLTAVVTALLFFGSLLLHELGHAAIAKRAGIEVPSIDLWMLGGMARMKTEPATPGEEFRISAAGPAVSLLTAIVCIGLGVAVGGADTVWKTIGLSDQVRVTPQFLALSVLATMNLVIFMFNLLPAWPLDGGRIARAIAWKVTGSKARATVFSANLGRLLSWALAIWGIWEVVGGNMGGLWWLMLAFFIGQSARGAMMQSKISERVHGRTVMQLMDRHPVTLPSGTTVDRAADEWFERYGWSWFPVVEPNGRFIGIAHEEAVRKAAELPGLGVPAEVASMIDPATSDGWAVSEMEPIENLLGNGPLARNGALMAVDDDGILQGVITVEQVYAALNDRSG